MSAVRRVLFFVLASLMLLLSACAESSENTGIEVIDVTNLTLSEAMEQLSICGFTNIVDDADESAGIDQWIVIKQSVKEGKRIGADSEIKLFCSKKCMLYIDVKSETNLLLNKYDVTIKYDGKEIGNVANGARLSMLIETYTGDHKLTFCKAGSDSPISTKQLSITGDTTFSCDLSHGSGSIDLKNIAIEESVDGASLEVPDVVGLVLSEAIQKLQEIGFANVEYTAEKSIWDKDNWYVANQETSAGTHVDKYSLIKLNCLSLDDYFNNTYTGKNIAEIRELALECGFSVIFENGSNTYLDADLMEMDEDVQLDWIATKARQYSGADKTAVVTVVFQGETIPIIEDMAEDDGYDEALSESEYDEIQTINALKGQSCSIARDLLDELGYSVDYTHEVTGMNFNGVVESYSDEELDSDGWYITDVKNVKVGEKRVDLYINQPCRCGTGTNRNENGSRKFSRFPVYCA